MKVRILSNNCFLIDSDSWLYCQSYETIVGMELFQNYIETYKVIPCYDL